MEWIDTNLLISICTCAIALIQFLFWKHIAKQKAYEAKKGENLATKEDIKEITEKVEQVKENYNKSLESHKAKLQKGLDSHRYRIEMCYELDNKLIKLMVDCIDVEISKNIHYPLGDREFKDAAISLFKFLHVYRTRYRECLYNLYVVMDGIYFRAVHDMSLGEDSEWGKFEIGQDIKETLLRELYNCLPLFLPRL